MVNSNGNGLGIGRKHSHDAHALGEWNICRCFTTDDFALTVITHQFPPNEKGIAKRCCFQMQLVGYHLGVDSAALRIVHLYIPHNGGR